MKKLSNKLLAEKETMDTLINNAIQSIQIGVEDFESDDPRRVLSAVRNITAGVLLLFKEKLRELSNDDSDEVLLKQKIKPILKDEKVVFVGSGKKTVDVHHIQERLTSLEVTVDWQRVHKIIKVRNNVEHYYLTENETRVKELIAESFVIIQDFIKNVFDEEPVDLLGEDTWTVLLNTAEVYKKEKEECKLLMDKVDWQGFTLSQSMDKLRCSTCQSELIKPVNVDTTEGAFSSFICMSCNNDFVPNEEEIAELIHETLKSEIYYGEKDGEGSPVVMCHECYNTTFILMDENQCALCNAEKTYIECSRCGGTLSTEEQHLGGFCGYCSHMYEKFMAE